MREVVLDASVVFKWFGSGAERHDPAARALRSEYEAGTLRVLVPQLLWLELLNVAGRRWGWEAPHLDRLAATLPALGFELVEADAERIATWVSRGLTAYDATYVAVAEMTGADLITDDAEILAAAPDLSESLGGSS